ncbi:MAG: amidohydrolase family protein [Lautropia sp.]
MPIYDLHSHWGTEKAYPLRSKAQQAKQIDIWKTECKFVSPSEMADYFRKNDVRVMLDYGFTRELPLEQVRELHDEMIAFGRANRDVVLGNWIQLNPDDGNAAIDELERVRAAGIGLTGLAVSAVGNRRPITDPSFAPFYGYCIEKRMPVMVFVGYTGVGAGLPGGHGIVLELSHPRDVDSLAARHPDLQIIAARPAWPWQSEMIATLLHKPNVWFELHGVSPKRLTDELKQEIRGRLKGKIMYANDFPMLHYEKIIGDWRAEGYPEDVLERIFHRNAERFLQTVGAAP